MKNCILLAKTLLVALFLAIGAAAQGVAAPYTMRLQPFLSGLNRPVLVRSALDGSNRIFILQQSGIVKVLQPGSSVPANFIDLSSKIVVPASAGDERGLLGLTFHPQFASNGKFYVDYTRAADGATVIAEYKTSTSTGASSTGDLGSERILLVIPQPFSNHNGGMIDFGPDGYLYIGMGDGGSGDDPGNRAQNPAQLLGKMLRIDVNVSAGLLVPYLIPPTNPFVGASTTRCDGGSTTAGNTCQEIWTIGMRNPWRWSFDRGGSNQLYAADVGQNAIEELDLITGGGNYGWRVYEGTTCNANIVGNCPASLVQTPPFFQYSHTSGRCSVSGGYVYRGGLGSLPVGAYTFADYCSGEIWMWNNGAQVLLQDTPRQVVSFGEDEVGEIYVCYSNGQIDKITRAKASADFDGDLKTDFAVFRPGDTNWYINNSSNSSVTTQQFGIAADIAAPEDYDGDNRTDIAVFRQSSGTWYYLRSSDGTFGAFQFGANGDVPAAGDFDGDAKSDFTVFRPSSGVWFTLRSSDGAFSATQFGIAGDVPVAGDYDGDGRYDICVFRPSDGVWYRLNSMNSGFSAIQFGASVDIPAPADLDGDGKLDNVVYRPSEGNWYSLASSTGAFQATHFGVNGDIPVAGDYDADGKDDIAVFRPPTGTWYVQQSSNLAVVAGQFGASGDRPAPKYDAP